MQVKPRLGISTAQLKPLEKISELDCPILIASGDIDRHTTLRETERMYQNANEPKNLVVFAGAAHVDLLEHDREKYVDEVIGFIDRFLAE